MTEEGNPTRRRDARACPQKLGGRGGLKGGRARAEKLTSEVRSEIARNAAEVRWDEKKPKGEAE